jgi:hypothetical protein
MLPRIMNNNITIMFYLFLQKFNTFYDNVTIENLIMLLKMRQ